ncbi:cartilage intermediate layer protein 2-like isoform X3 [Acropora muricata]|uniref:cartilage intermediate layer protein 2-like isoform X3 n=1 Tax=Acropora muricata TaxID=159855 RepID=UPI0034E6097A
MDSKQASSNSVHEMVTLGTSTEALIYAATSETEQPPADPDLVPVKFTVISSRKRTVLLATLIIVVVIATIFVGIFLSQHINNKDKDESQHNVKLSLSVTLTSSLNNQTQQAASSSTLSSSNDLRAISACSTCNKMSPGDISTPATTLSSLSSIMQLVPNTENYVKITPSVKMTSTLRSQTLQKASTSTLTSSIETRTIISTCSTCNKMSTSREDISSPATTLSPLSSIMELVPNADAKWSRWSPWSDCSKTCGNGTRFRRRTCVSKNQPPFQSAPISCAGKPQQTGNCSQWKCPDCRKICLKGTLNSACDACVCDDHKLTGRVQTSNNAPIAGAKVALSETPYKALARTDDKGFFTALNVCADANQELLISAAGFVPMKLLATVSTSTTANVLAKLHKSVPPTVTVHPQSKMRFAGDALIFCCDGVGNPSPEIEWFKDNNIIDKSVYGYDKNLELSNVTGLEGKYQCRVVNDYGSEFSDIADLRVFSQRDPDSCNPTPSSKNATLPSGCYANGTTSNVIDVGQCQPAPCIGSHFAFSNKTCQDENFCCSVKEVSDVTVSCGSSLTFTVSKVSRCGCQKCQKPRSQINGLVVGRKGDTEKPIIYSNLRLPFEGFSYRTNQQGFFSFQVPTGKKRLSVVFSDSFRKEYADVTKVFHVEEGKTLFSKIVLKPKPSPKPFNSSQQFKVQLGKSENDTGFAEMVIPEDSLLRDDGTVFSGQANLRMDVVNTRSLSDMVAAPADFTAVDEDGEEQMLASYGMLSLDFEDDRGEKLSPFKPIKLYLDPEKLNISVDSNGNTTTKLWWLDSTTGRWIEGSNLRGVLKTSGRGKRAVTHFILETEIAADISRQGTFNVDVVENFGAVGIRAPVGSSIRILCEEPNSSPTRYTGYFEETVGVERTICITVWIDRRCYIQGESSDSGFLVPSTPDAFPASVSAEVISNRDLQGSATRSVSSFRFVVKTSGNGPVFPRHSAGLGRCRNEAGVRRFEFENPTSTSLDLVSTGRIDDIAQTLNWYPQGYACFIKILVRGTSTSIFLVRSYGPNKSRHYGDSAVSAQRVSSGNNAFVACAEIRCPGNVFYPTTGSFVSEWTHVHVTHLTGNCDFQRNYLTRQQNLDGNNTPCPSRSKRHSPGSETLLCVPLPDGNFDIDYVYTADKNVPIVGKNRCLNGNNGWQQGQRVVISENRPTVEFSCS